MIISRKAEAEIPVFASHELARGYFKSKYGNQFIMMSYEEVDEQTVYFYALLLNPNAFYDGQKQLAIGEGFSGIEYLNSYQSIEIFEDGRIHIIH